MQHSLGGRKPVNLTLLRVKTYTLGTSTSTSIKRQLVSLEDSLVQLRRDSVKSLLGIRKCATAARIHRGFKQTTNIEALDRATEFLDALDVLHHTVKVVTLSVLVVEPHLCVLTKGHGLSRDFLGEFGGAVLMLHRHAKDSLDGLCIVRQAAFVSLHRASERVVRSSGLVGDLLTALDLLVVLLPLLGVRLNSRRQRGEVSVNTLGAVLGGFHRARNARDGDFKQLECGCPASDRSCET